MTVSCSKFDLRPSHNANYPNLHPGSNTVIPPLTLSTLLPVDRSDFFRYEGSLTTPPCSEAVIWTVLNRTVGISVEQVTNLPTSGIQAASRDCECLYYM